MQRRFSRSTIVQKTPWERPIWLQLVGMAIAVFGAWLTALGLTAGDGPGLIMDWMPIVTIMGILVGLFGLYLVGPDQY